MTRREDQRRDAKKIEVWHPSIRSAGHQAGVAVVTNTLLWHNVVIRKGKELLAI